VVVLLPSRRPLALRDVVLYWRVQRRLGRSIDYPNRRLLERRRLASILGRHRFGVEADESCSFTLPLPTAEHAEELVRSLYLPGVDAERRRHAEHVLRRRVGHNVTIPIRRLIWRRLREGV
jgi:hypothetical protein